VPFKFKSIDDLLVHQITILTMGGGMKKNALYIRTSTNLQETGAESQKYALEQFCKRNDISNYEIYEDQAFSGKNLIRPEFQRMMEDIRSNKIEYMFTYSFSRISRSTQDLLKIVSLLDKFNVKFTSISENFDTGTAAGKLMLVLLGAVNEFEREILSESVKRGMLNAKKKGKQIGRKKLRNSDLIRALYEEGKYSYREIAIKAKCSNGSVQAEITQLKNQN
jgi:DNA invertase Pin-like site-specific DNA recombinase